ncbi:g11258 [Coccomyxa elongata]
MEWATPSSRVGRRLCRRRVGETASASDMNRDEPAVAGDSTAQQPCRQREATARQRQRPAIPPGFESRLTASIAAQHAAQEALTAHLAAHLLGPELASGRWRENLRRQVKDIALQRSWAMAAQHRASLSLLEADGKAAMAANSRSVSAQTLLTWQDAHQLL